MINNQDTEEQINIYDKVVDGNSDLLIKARAGSGKTTTIVKSINLLPPDKKIIVLAFNKHIAKEIKNKLPNDNVQVYTTYGLGWGAVTRKYDRKKNKIELNDNKIKIIVNKLIKNWNLGGVKNIETYKENMIKISGLAKVTLAQNVDSILKLARKHFIKFETGDAKRVISVLEHSLNDNKVFDYNDMIFLPALDNKMYFFRYDYVFVDECQDINLAQLAIVKKILMRDEENNITGRVVYVGDDYQSIYGFNGSDSSIFNKIKQQHPGIIEMPLTISFRCGKNIIKKANELVPDIKAKDNAIDGVVREGSVLDEASPGDFILSRTMRPLIKLFFELLIKGKDVSIKGIDFKETLINLFKKYNSPAQLYKSLSTSLESIKQELLDIGITDFESSNQYLYYNDLIYAVDIISQIGKTQAGCINYCEKIFTERMDAILLSTIHRVKGLETNRVFMIQNSKKQKGALDWMKQEEDNLLYVAYTRAKEELIFDNNWKDE